MFYYITLSILFSPGFQYTTTADVTIKFNSEYMGAQVFEKGVPSEFELTSDKTITLRLDSGEGKFIIPLK